MRDKPYYSIRTGQHPTGGRLELSDLKHLVVVTYEDLRAAGYFQQVLGTECVDGGSTGTAGSDLEAFFFRKLKKRNLWPLRSWIANYDESDLFDVIELLHDCASKGVSGTYHSYNDCGTHYETFNAVAGQNDFRVAFNECLREYDNGYELTVHGEIIVLGPKGLRDLERAPRPPGDPKNVGSRTDAAVDKYRRRGASGSDRRDAVRDLADILEFIRPLAKGVLTSADEADLFNLANNFGIRHHNPKQKTHYDESIWLSWMFYYYLSAIHATTRLIEKAKASPVPVKKQKK